MRQTRDDLAELVIKSSLSLEAAEAQARKDAEERKQQRWATTVNIIDGVLMLDRAPELAMEPNRAISSFNESVPGVGCS